MTASWLAEAGAVVGAPYLPDGRDPSGWDCLGLVGYLRRLWWDKATPGYERTWPQVHDLPRSARARVMADLIAERMGSWRPVAPAAGAVVLLTVNNAAGHVGLMLDRVHFIHADGFAAATVISRVDRTPWSQPGRVRGFFDV